MSHHIRDFYRQSGEGTSNGHFRRVIALHESPEVDWETVSSLAPTLCKGWYELAHLDNQDRIDFVYDFWVSKLPYHPEFPKFLDRFFSSIGEIGIFVTQKRFDDPFEANLVYCLDDGTSFYRGEPPISEEKLSVLKQDFPDLIFPEDYLSFLKIHDGFCKTTDSTGIIRSSNIFSTYQGLQNMVGTSLVTTTAGAIINPLKLIPFYESFGMPYFQCFWADWYPQQEMGNVYFSGELKTISDVSNSNALTEAMAFPTFIDWLIFYLEQIV